MDSSFSVHGRYQILGCFASTKLKMTRAKTEIIITQSISPGQQHLGASIKMSTLFMLSSISIRLLLNRTTGFPNARLLYLEDWVSVFRKTYTLPAWHFQCLCPLALTSPQMYVYAGSKNKILFVDQKYSVLVQTLTEVLYVVFLLTIFNNMRQSTIEYVFFF